MHVCLCEFLYNSHRPKFLKILVAEWILIGKLHCNRREIANLSQRQNLFMKFCLFLNSEHLAINLFISLWH